MFSYPLQAHPCRASIDNCLKWRPRRRHAPGDISPSRHALLGSPKPPNKSAVEMGDTRFAIITTTVIVLSFVVAMTVSSLERVLAYVGSTGSTTISFILPGVFYYKISDPDSPHHQRLIKEDDDEDDFSAGSAADSSAADAQSRRQWKRRLLRNSSLALALYGVVVMVVCLATNTFLVAAH